MRARVCLCVAVTLAAAAARGALLPLDAERLRAAVGGFAVMNCHLDFPFGNEIPYHLHWDKDGETIFSWFSGDARARVADRWGGRVRLADADAAPASARALGRGSLNVSAVRETDAGLYRCRVAFPNRTPPARNNGTFYHLDVDGGNLIVTPPTNVTVVEGERAELECTPGAAGAGVQWTRDGAAVPGAASAAPNGSLVLRAAAADDAGLYACRVLGPGGAAQTASAYLDVHYKAKVVYAPEERYLPFGKPASLDCHFSANPPLTNLRWEKDGFLFDPYNVPGVFYSRNGSLLFNRVDESHEGEYSCTPYNALGSAGASGGVRVRVLRAPALARRPQPLYVARLGAALALPCAAQTPAAQPRAALVWTRKDGRELPPGRHALDGGNLTIVDVAEEDRGVYVCTASNEAGAVAAESELRVENLPPRAPHNLTARAGAAQLHLAWVPGHNGLEVEYEVWYRERAAGEWRTMKILSRGVTEATLLGLRPGAAYELRVLAQDRLGDGLFSQPLLVHTLPELAGAVTEPAGAAPEPAGAATEFADAAPESRPDPQPAAGGELQVSVRLIEEGALVRWRGAAGEHAAPCTLRWWESEGGAGHAGSEGGAGGGGGGGARLLATGRTHHDYMLVSGTEEGVRYWAQVQCAGGAAGGAALRVPPYARLRGAAAAAAGAALLLAALAAVAVLLRRRRCRRRHDTAPRPTKR